MLNFMVLVGKVKEIPEIRLTAAGTKIATMLLEVDRGFRNSNEKVSFISVKPISNPPLAEMAV